MSDPFGSSCSRALRNASFSDKPSYVRRLKFGQSILELDTVKQCHNRVLVDESVTRIPCTEKKEYVRKWIETHGDESGETLSKDTSQSSPVLGTSVTSVSVRSPILGSSSKRRRGKICINRGVTVKKRNQDCWENGGHFAMHFESDCGSDEENKTKQDRSSEIQRTPPCTENMVTDKLSPVLGTCQHRKKKWKKLQCDNLDIDLQREANNNCDSIRNISASGKSKENENIEIPYRITIPVVCHRYQTTFTPEEKKLNLQDSSDSNTDRNNITIEISTSEDSRDEACTKLSNSNASTDNNSCLSNLIEDVDTQVATQVVPSQLTSNKTYCSEVEIIMNQSIHLSAQISQMTSLNRTTQKTGDKLTQTDHISSITTPSKKSPDRNIYACILDSGKKRRKPKKGSMVSRLQSLVNAQVSDIRIWRHQMSKKSDAAVQFVSVFVCSCRKQFGNQFLDGILLEDRFNLLQSNEEIKETKSHIQVRSKQVSHKFITIMLVCDIVGTLKMISDVVINLYPPWVILDRDNLILEVTYISISDDNEVSDVANKSYLHKRKKQIVKEFKCLCIEEERELPFCSRKPTNDKPDMMEKIFEF